MSRERETEVLISVGTGGVGKTSVSAMLGFYYAHLGKKVLVVTIDPAKRLLQALGLKHRQGKAVLVERSSNSGELSALMPDLNHEWMDFLESSLVDKKRLQDISHNHFYRYITEGFSGSLEIICCHILYRLIESKKYDIIILDTPPSTHSLSFFEVPQKLTALLERSIFQLLMNKRQSLFFKFSKKLAFFSSSILHKTLEKIVGSHFLSEVIDFALSIDALYEPLYKRAKAMERLLLDKKTRWALVIRPTTSSVLDSLNFARELKQKGIKLDQLIINQVTPNFSPGFSKEMSPRFEKIINLYEQRLNYEQNLIEKAKRAFPKSASCKIFLKTLEDSSKDILISMLDDYKKELS